MFPPTILFSLFHYFFDVLDAAELYSGKRQCLSDGKSQILLDNGLIIIKTIIHSK